MSGRYVARMSVLLVVASLFGPATPSAESAPLQRCLEAVASNSEGDLRVEVDQRAIAFVGRVSQVDSETLHTTLSRVVDQRGEIDGLTVCASLSVTAGKATYVGESIPAVVDVLTELSSNGEFRAMWGGGGLTLIGWMRRSDLSQFTKLSGGAFPIDVSSVGVLENLPARVRLRIERVSISSSRIVQIEQFHPKVAAITLSTTSQRLLVACPGGWRGVTPSSLWKSAACVKFDASTPAVLPGSGNSNTHLSIAVRPVRGTAKEIDLDLRYTAVDPSHECYVRGRATLCDLVPLR
jgi:hypothetical protein